MPPAVGAWRLCTTPVSLTPLAGAAERAHLPVGAKVEPVLVSATDAEREGWRELLRVRIPAATRGDEAYYWLHVVLGVGLTSARCDTTAGGVQWAKAAIHARSVDQAERVAGGIHSLVTQSAEPLTGARSVCLTASPRNWADLDHVSLTFALAGVYCSPATAPARVASH